jgi:hypothetical protein
MPSGIGDEIATAKAALAHRGIFRSDELLPPLLPVDEQRRALRRIAIHPADANLAWSGYEHAGSPVE